MHFLQLQHIRKISSIGMIMIHDGSLEDRFIKVFSQNHISMDKRIIIRNIPGKRKTEI